MITNVIKNGSPVEHAWRVAGEEGFRERNHRLEPAQQPPEE